MRLPETHDQSASVRATTKKIGMRIAALTGVVLSAGVIAAAPSVSAAPANADVVLDSVVSVTGGGNGSTCCRPEN
ncbi:hypothetical protein ACFWNN_08390 [Lentzea sp. NPDC058450]|uniref:hypothetical protein n=1 Tax=Lentzea sp. NPDC058450 TaxID=3346505 RepID=UPI003651219D